eukprot:gene54338-43207_t
MALKDINASEQVLMSLYGADCDATREKGLAGPMFKCMIGTVGDDVEQGKAEKAPADAKFLEMWRTENTRADRTIGPTPTMPAR